MGLFFCPIPFSSTIIYSVHLCQITTWPHPFHKFLWRIQLPSGIAMRCTWTGWTHLGLTGCWTWVRTGEHHPSCRWLRARAVFLQVNLWHSTPSSNQSAICSVADFAELPVCSCKTGIQTTAQEWRAALPAKTQQMVLCHQALLSASPRRKRLTSGCWRCGPYT